MIIQNQKKKQKKIPQFLQSISLYSLAFQMQRIDAAGNIFIAGGRKFAKLFAKVFEYQERGDRRSVILDVQFVVEGGLE